MGGISIWQIIIVVAVVALLFGGKRLRNFGGDLGASLKGFKKAIKDDGSDSTNNIAHSDTIEGTATKVDSKSADAEQGNK